MAPEGPRKARKVYTSIQIAPETAQRLVVLKAGVGRGTTYDTVLRLLMDRWQGVAGPG